MVDEFAKVVCVEANAQGVDGKVAPVKVVFEGAVFNDGLARVAVVAFASGAHKLNFDTVPFHLGRTEVLIDGRLVLPSQTRGKRPGGLDAVAYHHDVDIIGRPVQEEVAHITANQVAGVSQTVGRFADGVEDVLGLDFFNYLF